MTARQGPESSCPSPEVNPATKPLVKDLLRSDADKNLKGATPVMACTEEELFGSDVENDLNSKEGSSCG